MSNQYFDNNEKLRSDIITIDFYFKGKAFTFKSDNGVFSKKEIDFGSRLLLQNVIVKENYQKCLDVGCGYGPIGIVLATVNSHITVDMIDVNNRAILLAKQNVEQHHLTNVNVYNSDMYTNVKNQYDLIVTNPPIRAGKMVVHNILLNGFDYLKTGGSLWCVIQKKQGAPSAIEALEKKYRQVSVVCKDKGYYIIKADK